MKRIKVSTCVLYLLAGLGTCIFLLGSPTKSHTKPNTAPKQFSPSVESAVSKLEIVQTKMLGPNVLQVILRNAYSKDITAVVASIGNEKVSRRDYIFAEREQSQKLSPGATDEFLYTIDSGEEEHIVIKAVLFSDMTREGSPTEITKVLDKRLGVKIQLARFNSQLQKLNKVDYTKADYTNIKTEFRNVKQLAEILSIKTDSDITMSQALEYGLKHGKAFILKYLSEIDNQLGDDRSLTLLLNEQHTVDRYERFRKKSLKVENDFKSLESRL